MSSLGKFVVNGKNRVVKVAASGLYVDRKVRPVSEVYGMMAKGDVRRLRKTLREVGQTQFAAAPRFRLTVEG